MAKEKKSKKVTVDSELEMEKIEGINFEIPLSDFANIKTNGLLSYKFYDIEAQRDPVVPNAYVQRFFVSIMFSVLTTKNISTENTLYKRVITKYDIVNSSLNNNVTRMTFNNIDNTVSILNGGHRIISAFKILNNDIDVPTLNEAMKKNIYVPIYNEIYNTYGGKKFSELPTSLQQKLRDYKITVVARESNDIRVSQEAFITENSCRAMSKNDNLNAIFCNEYFWKMLVALSYSFDKRQEKYPQKIFYKNQSFDNPIKEDVWKACRELLSSKNFNNRISFLLRNVAIITPQCIIDNSWGNNNDTIRTRVLNYYSGKCENTVNKTFEKLFNRLSDTSIIIENVDNEVATVYTATLDILNTITKSNICKLKNNNVTITTDVLNWLDTPSSLHKDGRKNSDIMNNSFSNWNRYSYAKTNLKKIMLKHI